MATSNAVTEAIQELAESSDVSVAMIGPDDTHFLVAADIKPWFRYSPTMPNLLTKPQVVLLQRQILDHPPDYLLLPSESPPVPPLGFRADDVYQSLRELVQEHYTLEKRVAGMLLFRHKG